MKIQKLMIWANDTVLKHWISVSLFFSGLLYSLPSKVFADTNPWGGDSNSVNPSNLQETVSKDTTGTLKTVSIVVGTFLLLGGVSVLYRVLSRDADERKEHGNSIITILIAALSSVVGIILLGIAWKGLSYNVGY